MTQPYLTTRTYEPFDSTFIEVSLLKNGTESLQQSFVVGVLNRRCNPFDYTDVPTTGFKSYAKWETSLMGVDAAQRGDARFRQKGAREIELPFQFKHPDGRYRNLRVREVGAETNPAIGKLAIDTIVGQDQILHVNFLPGEGKMLLVTVLDPVAVAAVGYLDHSNQRKLVYYPEVTGVQSYTDPVDGRTYWPTVYGDNAYYHMVYYKRRAEPNGKLSVYYRRSAEIAGDRAHDASHLSSIIWENEILISDDVRYDFNGDGILEPSDPDCAYPSLVARFDPATNMSKVYVVFACESEEGLWGNNILIAETVLPAEGLGAAQAAYYTANHARGLALATQPFAHSLKDWGTPTINASYAGNWYAWSSYANGINVNFKEANELTFASGPVRFTHAIRENAALNATHPSLNTYSRQHIGEDDAALVWQEGNVADQGNYIYYTRLRLEVVDPAQPPQPRNYLFPNLNPPPMLSPNLAYNATRTIATLDAPDFFNGSRKAYPVIYRNLSDWPITSTHSLHQLRMVNAKSDRVMWEWLPTPPWQLQGAKSTIVRRALDFRDETLRNPVVPDESWAMPNCFITHDGTDLRGPDISQGWEFTNEVGGTEPVGPWSDDSTNVLNFWSLPYGDQLAPSIWHMEYGWEFYGQITNDRITDLVAAGKAEKLTNPGIYPHLAARNTMHYDRGWSKNRRVFNGEVGTWENWTGAPTINQSSEQFFKRNANPYKAEVLRGFRNDEADLTVSSITNGSDEGLVLHPVFDENKEVSEFRTDWFTVRDFAEQGVDLFSTKENAAATLSIERELDGVKLDVNAGLAVGKSRKSRTSFTLVNGGAERYRYIVEPSVKGISAVEDIALSESTAVLKKLQPVHTFLDLYTMKEHRSTSSLEVFPTQATDQIQISVRSEEHNTRSAAVEMIVTDALGRQYFRASVSTPSVTHIDISAWPAGMYKVIVPPQMTLGKATLNHCTFVVMR